MSNKKSYIGKILLERESESNRFQRGLERLEVSIKNVSDLYVESFGEFSKDVLKEMLEYKTQKIQERILSTLEEQLRNSGITIPSYIETQKQLAIQSLMPLGNAVKSMVELYVREVARQPFTIDILNFVNDVGQIVIDESIKARITDMFSISIKNEAQNELYCDFLELKEKVDSFINKVKKKGFIVRKLADEYDASAFLFIDNEKMTIDFNPYVIEDMN